jgi:hypothetical protein
VLLSPETLGIPFGTRFAFYKPRQFGYCHLFYPFMRVSLMQSTSPPLDGQVMIPDLLAARPEARTVLDRYGLQGCGGPLGPVETLEFFARAHDVELSVLLAELRTACLQPPSPPAAPGASLADWIYRPFFQAGIVVVLTLGAAWGAYLLLCIGLTGSFRAAGLHEVNAHGHAQIFGWVGLFVMGFAYQAFPRFKHTTLVCPPLALASLVLMLTGIVGRSVGEPLASTWPQAGTLAVACSWVEVAAIGLFVGLILATWRASGKGLAFYDYYVLAALGWFILQAVGEAVYLAATLATQDHAALLNLVRTWQGALREMQIHGFALLMILGVSQRIFHNFYGFRKPRVALSVTALACLNLAVVGEVVGLVLMQGAGHGWAAVWYAAVLLLACSVVALVWDWRIFTSPPERDRSLKFLRAAYVWLFVALGMLVLVPVYQFAVLPALAPASDAAHIGFSHAYYGAIRHAITVGFVSLMIVGMAAKVVPTLNGQDVHGLTRLWAPFVLLNTGCALRVVGQTRTDFTASAFPAAGVSGILEVLGLALWGVHLWAVMLGRARTYQRTPVSTYVPGGPITARHRVDDVLEHHPDLLATFVGLGFRLLASPVLRKTVARHVTIEQACRRLGKDQDSVLAALNHARQQQAPRRLPLPLLSAAAPVEATASTR